MKNNRPTDKVDASLAEPPISAGADYLLNTFFDLNAGRGTGQNGPSALAYTELAAYADLTGEPLEPWEVKLLKVMDAAYLRATYKYLDKVTKDTRK